MKLHRISLRDYKGIRSVRIEPREHGVTIIEGDNEAGKSSIAEAIWLIFEQNDDSASQLVKGLKPADRDAATEIEVEVSSGPYRFTYSKRFHRGSRTELTITAPRRETLFGREAHVRARQMLDETIDRALWEALRLQQGANLDPIAAGMHSSLLSALDIAAGEVMGGDREETLFGRITQEYERYYTPSGRERGSGDGPNVPRLRAARDAAQAEVDRIANRIASLEERSSQATECQSTAAGVTSELERVRREAGELEESEAGRRSRQSAVEALTAEVRVHASDLHAAESAREARAQHAAGIAPRREEHQKLIAKLAAMSGPLEQALQAREEAQGAAAAASETVAAADAARANAEHSLQLASEELMADTMTERLERLERNEPEAAALAAAIAGTKVNRQASAAIQAAERRLERIEARRDAEGASVEIASDSALEFEINGKPAKVEAGSSRRGTVLGDSTLVLPGGIRITIKAGAAAREIADESAAAKADLQRLLAEAGVDSPEAARAQLEERLVTEERLRGLQEQLKADLRDLGSAEELRQKLGRERARVAALRHDAGSETVSIDAAKAAVDAASRAATEAELAARSARTLQSQAESAVMRQESERDQDVRRLAELDADITAMEAELAERRAQQPDEAFAEACREHAQLHSAAEQALREATEAGAAFPDRAVELLEKQTAIRTLEAEAGRLAERYAGLLGVLEDAGAEGLHGLLLEAEQRLVVAEAELAAFVRRANAACTLYQAMRAARDTARSNYAAPLRQNIESLGRRVFGESFAVELMDDLRIARVSREGLTLDLAQLSVGVREQLAVLTRLACAALVSSSGGAPVVLDDIFGWADPARLRALGPILAATAAESQVLLFTCTPERFATVAPARVISLPGSEVTERPAPGEEAQPPAAAQSPADAARRAPAPAAPVPQATFDLFAEPAGTASSN